MFLKRGLQRTVALVFLAVIIVAQYYYDDNALKNPPVQLPGISADFIKAMDLGLHSAVASYYWVEPVMAQTVTLDGGLEKYKQDLQAINALDPKFSFPYYWTLLLLPNQKYPETIDAAIEAGERGIREADADWRVSFYLATLYHFYKHDYTNAVANFDRAARAPNAPDYIRRFGQNFGTTENLREQTKLIWEAIGKNSDDPILAERAKAYVERFNMVELLERASREYKRRYWSFPATLDKLVSEKVLSALPVDPFGFKFSIDRAGIIDIIE